MLSDYVAGQAQRERLDRISGTAYDFALAEMALAVVLVVHNDA
jgi:hypothetical protein